jgi:hypothetical protein
MDIKYRWDNGINNQPKEITQKEIDYLQSLVNPGYDDDSCKAKSPGGFWCTRTYKHNGPHVAHGSGIHAVWDNENDKQEQLSEEIDALKASIARKEEKLRAVTTFHDDIMQMLQHLDALITMRMDLDYTELIDHITEE